MPTGAFRRRIEYGIGTSIAYAAFLLILRQTSAATPHVAAPLAEATLGATAGAAALGLIFGGCSSTSAGPRSAGCCCSP